MYEQKTSKDPVSYLLAKDLLDGVTDDENEWEASKFIVRVIYPAYSL